MLEIGGIEPFSTLDYPGKLAAVLFCQGCPWDCPYCHNAHLRPLRPARPSANADGGDHTAVANVVAPAAAPASGWSKALALLQQRRQLLDAVVFSGGEPLAQPSLTAAMQEVRDLGFAIGLHSAGVHTKAFGRALPLCDWVGLDVKAPRGRYAPLVGRSNAAAQVEGCLRRLVDSGIDYEIRTTVDPRQLDAAALLQLADELASAGARRWRLQRCRGLSAGSASIDLAGILPALRERIADCEIR
ncbi:radical SAM protein [Rhodocyclus tenuis]|uniref:Radical SAM protein n=2 Tax=Rhodocyclus TaxID=1064 RepID=A0A6L5JSZ9_RHOTE|nr:radical SAM protein [Rhodocyclus gracilis]MQY50503.1 radical SAM protein [Rhodocyclus gracilis]MRD72497.1 radical SAM protein [Rhodocyclus gracilis]NJA88007.1 radical SAM protein [Rhodocyclus gracilis]